MGILLAGLSAVILGVADYCGGIASRRSTALAAVFISYVFSLAAMLIGLLLTSPAPPTRLELTWGIAGGVASAIGIALLYAALAAGAMSIVAPITAVFSALLPLVAGIIIDGSPNLIALIGVSCAIVAIALIARTRNDNQQVVKPRVIALAFASGAGFGTYFLCVRLAEPPEGSLWPALSVYVAGTVLGTAVMWIRKSFKQINRTMLPFGVQAGILSAIGTTCYVLAIAGGGPLAIIAPIAALYPASTVLLALVRDHEPISVGQAAGLTLAAAALTLAAVA